jgi:alanyl-tRNA synthetase
MEEAFELRRSISEAAMEEEVRGSRRGSGYVRRSFFRRRNRHQRNNSKDSRELSSFSDASINSDSLAVLNGESGFT